MTTYQLAQPARPRAATAVRAAPRLAYLDNLRIFLAAMVIAHHVGQAYGPTGGEWPIFNATRAEILGPFFAVNASFFMGLFYLISGYFVPAAVDRKGIRRFVGERLVRLGVPLLVFSLVLVPLATYALAEDPGPFGAYMARSAAAPEVGPLWFVSLLLVFSVGYALWRWVAERGGAGAATGRQVPAWAVPGHREIALFTAGLAVVTFVVRLAFSVDEWIEPLPFVRIEPAHLPQYLALFAVGMVAWRRDWLSRLPARTGALWLRLGLAGAAFAYGATLLWQATGIDVRPFDGGGASFDALAWSALEALICVGLSIGLVTFFRERLDGTSRWLAAVAGATYAAFVIHIFPVVVLQTMLADSAMPPLAKFAILTPVSIVVTFALALGLRRIPGVSRVL